MEGKSIYEDSQEELKKITKTLGSSQTVIDWTKLDERSKEEIGVALSNAAYKRIADINSVILGVQ